ncbi:MAG: zinc ribbon domain-containing protein [Myxococcales bacterium]|nr:zinc ribbon domain-containing protein [Myxococcales bacterium]
MAMPCPQCGTPNQSSPGFCAQCGTALATAPAQAPLQPSGAAKTVLGMSVNDLLAQAPPPAPVAPPAPAAAPSAAGASRTVLGMPAMGGPVGVAGAPPGVPAAPQAAPMPMPPGIDDGRAKTMLGVAVPGIAPLQPGASMPAQPSAVPASGPARVSVANEHRTMLGVPVPGQAAPAAPIATGIFIAPAPAPLALEALPEPPSRVTKRGAPLGIVAGALFALVLGIGGTAAYLMRGGNPLVIQARPSPRGTDLLHIACDSCPDGTKLSVGAAASEVKAKSSDLELQTPLVVGENALTLHIDRPGSGRDEDVKAVVPVGFRVRMDLDKVGESPPAAKVVVEAAPGATVSLDGKPLALENGRGTWPLDLSADCAGMADETRAVEKTVTYEVTLKGQTEKGAVTAKVGVPALRIDAPFAGTVLASEKFTVSGRTIKGATVTVNGRPVTVDAAGVFAEGFSAPTSTPLPVEVRATLPQSAPRTVSLKVRRSDRLEAEARAAQKAALSAKYTDILKDASSVAGKPFAVEGDLVDLRATNHQAVLLVRSATCDRPEGCIFRVLSGAPAEGKTGTRILATGRITKLFSGGGTAVPEVEADIVVPVGRRL